MNTKTNTKNKKKLMLGTMAGAMALTGVAGTVAPLLNGEATVVEAATLGDYQYIDNGDGTATISGYTGTDENVIIPNEINGLTVVKIGNSAFSGKRVKNVVLPDTLKVIGRSAFSSGSVFGDLIIPASVEEIHSSAFSTNRILNVIFEGTTPISIETGAFSHNNISSFVVPEWMDTIPEFLFSNNILTEVQFHDGVKNIGNRSFEENQLTSIEIPESVSNIAGGPGAGGSWEGAFSGNNISEITIKGATTTINEGAFFNNQSTPSNMVMYAPNPSIAYNFGTTKGYTMMEYIPPEPVPVPVPVPEEGTGGSTETGTPGNEQTNQINASIINGDLLLDPVAMEDFEDIPLSPEASTHYASITAPLKVTDARGTNEGWSLNVSATPFASVDHALPAGSLTLKGVESITATSTTPGVVPSNTLSATTVIDDGSVVVAEALNGEGAGVFEIAFPQDALGLTVDPGTAEIGDYSSTVTWTLASTPTGV